jgi:pimeloyl-ACP methyl ester carboxylesterase
MKKLYSNTSYGQVHARIQEATGDASSAPLVCLHPAPSSGLYFKTAMPLLNDGRDVLAPDYPGYGGSDPLDEPPAIGDYASAILEFLDSAGIDCPVDILGFHTGCLVAVEMAHLNLEAIRKIVLCDIPYFTAEQQDGMRDKVTQPMPLGAELQSLEGPWAFNVGSRIKDVAIDRAFELFAEHCRAGTRDWYGFGAAFSYDCVGRFSTLHADVTCLATQSGLHAPTVAAAAALPTAEFIDVPEVTTAVFEVGAEAIAKRIREALWTNTS